MLASTFFRCFHASCRVVTDYSFEVLHLVRSNLPTLLSAHAYTIVKGHAQNRFIASKLILSYASLGHPVCSTKIFVSVHFKDLFLWNSIIKAHFSAGNYAEAIEFFSQMRFLAFSPDEFTLPMVVSASAELGSLFLGMCIHCFIAKANLFYANSAAIGASLVYMYSKCEAIESSALAFGEIIDKDVVAWTALVIGYIHNGENEKSFRCLREMLSSSNDAERVNLRTLEGGFQACGNAGMLVEGTCLHSLSLKSGIASSNTIRSAILSLYSKYGSIEDARLSFDEVLDKDLFCWTSIIAAYTRNGQINESFRMFLSMQEDHSLHPDGMLVSCLIPGFSNSLEGKAFHGFIIRRNYAMGHIASSSLLSMYIRFGLLAFAENVFMISKDQEPEPWNSMISGYEKSGFETECLDLFREQRNTGMRPDSNCLISVISACARTGAIRIGKSVHCFAVRSFSLENMSIVNSVMSMYGKFGHLGAAERLFLGTKTKADVVSWNSLISCYAENGNPQKALTLFGEMISEGMKPNTATLVILLSACGDVASLEKGRRIHDHITTHGYEVCARLGTALIDMYGKCGQVERARELFDSLEAKDVVTWNVMISAYAMNGCVKSAISIFEQMEGDEANPNPNGLTFLAVLSGCVHSGMLEEARDVLDKMSSKYGMVPSVKHYGCMVDAYGRRGMVKEAEDVINGCGEADGEMWGSLVSACRVHGDGVMGVKIAKRAIEADPDNDGYYVLLSEFYGMMEMWDEVEGVRDMIKDRGLIKALGSSELDINF